MPTTPKPPAASVVVIGHNDAAHVAEAVRSALAQGPAVRQVVAVDDGSTDRSPKVLARLAAGEPRLTVLRRAANSGGCGSPRNDGLAAVTSPYVMFLDSDDVLPAGAVAALLAAAARTGAEVAAGRCVRRELPSGREHPWQPDLYAAHAVVAHPARRPRLVHDTLCVNKLYRTGFLHEHGIRFPEGPFRYEDFVFTARVLAAAPRVALVPETVYVWQVRRAADRLSLSLDRADIGNWRARTRACALAHAILLGAGHKELARAARAKFLDHDLRMYARELALRDASYRRAWWAHTRAYLEQYDVADFEVDPAAPGPLLARVVLASPGPRDLGRLGELAARPARLCPPYARTPDGTPVWSEDLPRVTLAPLLTRPVRLLPLAVDAELRPRARATRLRLRLHELYGRVARADPTEVATEWRSRADGHPVQRRTAALTAAADGTWSAAVSVDLDALGGPGAGTWDLRLRVRFADGAHRDLTAHAVKGAGRLRRRALPSARHGLLLVHPYATHSGALALRVAPGVRGAVPVIGARLRRLLHWRRSDRGGDYRR
ncbi:glycosyltransferase family 2 protein [Streptomyces sp. NPDC056161]|uniref:glycosyltransferase family 2 protein n=1 Tax=Streptomyces sp. NPDC056161 TaxID=3345732 RepID=UPI0035DB4DFC